MVESMTDDAMTQILSALLAGSINDGGGAQHQEALSATMASALILSLGMPRTLSAERGVALDGDGQSHGKEEQARGAGGATGFSSFLEVLAQSSASGGSDRDAQTLRTSGVSNAGERAWEGSSGGSASRQ